MLRDSIQTSNKYFKVLYGPLDHVFFITVHNRPYKHLVLYDDSFRQIRKIDVSNVSSFQTRCIHSESTTNIRNRTQTVRTTKYVLEIYFGATNRRPLTFTSVSFVDCEALSREIENAFGVRVYSYGSLNTSFKNALKNIKDPELVTEKHGAFCDSRQKYALYKEAADLKSLYELAHFDAFESSEPDAEVSSKFPVLIEGDMEDGSFVTYRDIRAHNAQANSVYKVEWYLSKEVGSGSEYFEAPADTCDTFYISEYMIGHYLMVKVYRGLKVNDARSYVYSTAERGPIYPSSLLCHHILVNSSRRCDFHDVLISTLDLDVLFRVVDKANKFGVYEPFNHPDVINNFQVYQEFVKCSEDRVIAPPKEPSAQPAKKAASYAPEPDAAEPVGAAEDSGEDDLTKMAANLLEGEGDAEPKTPKYNDLKLKLAQRAAAAADGAAEPAAAGDPQALEQFEEDSLNFIFGKKAGPEHLKDLHETTTVSELSDYQNVRTFDEGEYARDKKRFSLLGLFKSAKKREASTPKASQARAERQPLKGQKPPREGFLRSLFKRKPKEAPAEKPQAQPGVNLEEGQKMVIKDMEEPPKEPKPAPARPKPEKPKPQKQKGKKVTYDRKYEKQMRQKKAQASKQPPKEQSNPRQQRGGGKPDPRNAKPAKGKAPPKGGGRDPKAAAPKKRAAKGNPQQPQEPGQTQPKPAKKGWGLFSLFRKKEPQAPKSPQHNPNNELDVKRNPEQESFERFMKFVDTMQSVPVKLKTCLNVGCPQPPGTRAHVRPHEPEPAVEDDYAREGGRAQGRPVPLDAEAARKHAHARLQQVRPRPRAARSRSESSSGRSRPSSGTCSSTRSSSTSTARTT